MATAQGILDTAKKRYNPSTRGYGMLTRKDVVDFIDQLAPEMDKKTELLAFLDECTFLSAQDRERLLDDLDSYGL